MLPSFQGRGIGRRLFAAIAIALEQRGVGMLMLWTLAANPVRRWYKQLGGTLVTDQQLDIDGVTIVEVAYSWPEIARLSARLKVE